MDIAIDFDGTCVTHDFPNEGKDIGAQRVLRRLILNGHDLILYTMRSGATLETAIQWFLKNGIKLHGVQYNPTQAMWTSSNKCYAHLYIDDAALGCPLLLNRKSPRPYVNWGKVEKMLIEKGFIKI
jgi:hypothetical protein